MYTLPHCDWRAEFVRNESELQPGGVDAEEQVLGVFPCLRLRLSGFAAAIAGSLGAVGLFALLFATSVAAQTPAKVDFKRDVQPIFRSNCYGCHGAKMQKNNFRLDRRSDAMRGGTIPVIGPGNSAGSRLYMRLIGDDYGLRMPPTGPLPIEQINTIKAWIDQGAEWPDDASGEVPPPPPDFGATRIMDALRNGDRRAFARLLTQEHAHINSKGPGGSTPLMYAALYSDADSVRRLLDDGANPNLANEAGATALMWATDSLEKTQLLIEHGADVNAVSNVARTPLMITAGTSGSASVVKLLLERGANPSAKCVTLFGVMTPLAEAAYVGNDDVIRMLIDHGADVKGAGINPLANSFLAHCTKCVDLLIADADRENLDQQLFLNVPPITDGFGLKALLDHGADVKAKDPAGNPVFALAAASDALPVDALRAMIAKGVDVNAKTAKGQTALELAEQRGHTAVVDLLIQAGATDVPLADPALTPSPATSPRDAVTRAIPLLQDTDATFSEKSGCISCHNNTFTAASVAAARKRGIAVNEQVASKQSQVVGAYIESWREKVLQGFGIPGDTDTIGYILLGLGAQHYPADAGTDALARFVKVHQLPGGNWPVEAHRPPIESSEIEAAAVAMRAMQLYAPKTQRDQYEKSIARAAAWLRQAQAKSNEDKSFRLLGLYWAKADRATTRAAAQSLLADQRSDGGWAQIPTLPSDGYATGQALVALRESKAISASNEIYKRGSRFLMNSQFADGSWFVKTRALPIQPYFESGFPYGHDQFISAAATNWAAQALALAQ